MRLWIDDARALAWMAPDGAPGVEVLDWPSDGADLDPWHAQPADVVIEGFGCGLPESALERMQALSRAGSHGAAGPLWINLEYLTAEPYAERCHGLASPQSVGAAAGLTAWFYYPGFTTGTGGLLRQPDLASRRERFDPVGWLREQGIVRRPGERLVSLFCYPNPCQEALLKSLAQQPTLLLTAPGAATEQTRSLLGSGVDSRLRAHALPWLSQPDYDHLLWSCDLNFVRGEDSFVRAVWAGRPFVWQIYPQDDGAHAAKLEAFWSRVWAPPGSGIDEPSTQAIRDGWWHWNGLDPGGLVGRHADDPWAAVNSPAAFAAWQSRAESLSRDLMAERDLVTQLLAFVSARWAPEDAKI